MKRIIQIFTIASMMLAWENQSFAMMSGPQTTQKLQEGRRAIGALDWVKADTIIKELRAGRRTREADTLAQEIKQAHARLAPTPPTPVVPTIIPAELQNLLNLIGGGVNSIAAANGVIQNITRLINPAPNVTLNDSADIIRELFNFLGGTGDGVTSVVNAIQRLDQWTGNPMASGYNPATQPFNLQSFIVPGWDRIQPLLLTSAEITAGAGAAQAITNAGSLLARILPPPTTGTRHFEEFNFRLNSILRSCGTLGTPTTPAVNLGVADKSIDLILRICGKSPTPGAAPTQAADLNEAAQNLLTLINNLQADLTGTDPNYQTANIATTPAALPPALDIEQMSNDLIEQTGQALDPALATFLTDGSGAPADQNAAVKKVQAFQNAVNALYPTHPGNAQDLDALLPMINDLTVIARKTLNIQGKLAKAGYVQRGNLSAIGVPVLKEILDDILNIR